MHPIAAVSLRRATGVRTEYEQYFQVGVTPPSVKNCTLRCACNGQANWPHVHVFQCADNIMVVKVDWMCCNFEK